MAAVSYDCLLLFAILFVGTATVLPLNHGEAIAPNNAAYSAYLLGLSFLYFGWFWTHGGQTLGMRAWKVRVRLRDGGPVGWPDAALRFGAALFSWLTLGLGFAWAAIDRDHLAWHDRLSGTVLTLERRR